MQRHLDLTRASDGVLNDPQRTDRWERIAGHGIETGIEGHIVIRSVETCMIEEVQKVCRVLQVEAFGDLCVLEDGEVHTRLEGTAKGVSSAIGEDILDIVTERGPGGGWPARRDTALAGLE